MYVVFYFNVVKNSCFRFFQKSNVLEIIFKNMSGMLPSTLDMLSIFFFSFFTPHSELLAIKGNCTKENQEEGEGCHRVRCSACYVPYAGL